MTSAWTKFGIHDRRAFWFLATAAQVWVGCSGPSSPKTGDAAPPVGSAAGSDSDAGIGDCDDCAGSSSAGASTGDGGNAGAAGAAEAAGAAGIANAPDGGASGASGASNSDFVPAPHPPFPLVTAHGGPVLENIEIVPVYFGDDPLRVDLERFNTWIVGSDYWKQVGAEYGVHTGTRLPAVRFDSVTAGSISDTEIASWIDARVTDGSLPKPTANTVYALFYQTGTTITNATGTSCRVFASLHEHVSLANPVFTGNVPFVIIPRCSFSPGDELMIATNVASHEYVEAATDPLSLANPAWFMANDSGPLEAWQILTGPEIADLCENQSYDVIEGFTVQDMWSNSAAQAGNNPCQPSDPKHPFFMVAADATIYHAQPGATLTIHAGAWSNMPTPDWSLGINWGWVPYSDFDGQAVLSRTTVNNGDELTATVTIPENPPVTDGRSVYRFTIDSIDPINPNFSHPWPVLVIVP
jgi:hypothetical protein